MANCKNIQKIEIHDFIKDAIRAYVKENHISYETLSRKLGLSKTVTRHWVSGIIKAIDLPNWIRLYPLIAPYISEEDKLKTTQIESTIDSLTLSPMPVNPNANIEVLKEALGVLESETLSADSKIKILTMLIKVEIQRQGVSYEKST